MLTVISAVTLNLVADQNAKNAHHDCMKIAVVRHMRACKAHLSKLIDPLACVVCMHAFVFCTKMPPLEAIDRPQIPDFPVNKSAIASHHAYLRCLGKADDRQYTPDAVQRQIKGTGYLCIDIAHAFCGCLLACQ